MKTWDWVIVGAYCVAMLPFGIFFAKAASKNAEAYFIAGRRLPWWVLGFSAVATYTCAGAAPAFTGMVYEGGLWRNWVWWLNYAIWMPIVAVIWAKLWRRMRIVTTAEFVSLRYGSRPARFYRPAYATYMVLLWACVLNGYVIGWLLRALGPVFGWSDLTLAVFSGAIILGYCVTGGLFAVAYSDVAQFTIFIVANAMFIPILIAKVGGWDAMWANIHSQMSPAQFSTYTAPVIPAGDYGIMAILAFTVLGLFYAISPSGGEGYTAQRFMAAKNEFHAQVGQLFNAIMTLIVRMVPFIFLGLVARALMPGLDKSQAETAWGLLVSKYSVVGLTGFLVAAELAAFMSTIDTQINWGASYVVNDLCKPYMSKYSERTFVWIGRIATAVMMVVGIIIALSAKDMFKFFVFINGVAIAPMLPIAWLRFFWWRFNIWGELAGLFIALPASIGVWYGCYGTSKGFDDMPQGVLILFGIGWAVILTATLLTKPEPMEKLIEFYKRCRPPGFWGPVIRAAGLDIGRQRSDTIRDIIDCTLGIAACVSSIVVMTSLFGRHYKVTAVAVAILGVSAIVFALRWTKRTRTTESTEESAS
jgi:Na+/proline symporter